MTHARLGSHGKHVHALAELVRMPVDIATGQPSYYGASICKKWAGDARLTDEPVTCRECLWRMRP